MNAPVSATNCARIEQLLGSPLGEQVTAAMRAVQRQLDAALAPSHVVMAWSRRPGSLGAVWWAFVNAYADRARARRVHCRARTAATRARGAAMVQQAEYCLREAMGALCRHPEFISRRELYRCVVARQASERRSRIDFVDDIRMQWDRLCANAAEGDTDAADLLRQVDMQKVLRQVDMRKVGDSEDDEEACVLAADDDDRPRRPRVPEDVLYQALAHALAECEAGPRFLQFRDRGDRARRPWRGRRKIDPLNLELPELPIFFEVLRHLTFAFAISLAEEECAASRPTGGGAQSSEEDARRRALRAYLRGERSAEATRQLLGMKTPGAVRTAAHRLHRRERRRNVTPPGGHAA